MEGQKGVEGRFHRRKLRDFAGGIRGVKNALLDAARHGEHCRGSGKL